MHEKRILPCLLVKNHVAFVLLVLVQALAPAQTFPVEDPVIKSIWAEAMDSSQLPTLAHHVLDVIGPRLVGTPQVANASTWAVERYREWGIEATNELRSNVVLVASLAYLASEDPEFLSRERRVLPPDTQTGKPGEWPKLRDPERKGGLPPLPEKQPEHNP